MTLSFAGMVVLQRRQPLASMIAVNALGALGSGLVGLANSPHPPLSFYDLAIRFIFGLTTISNSNYASCVGTPQDMWRVF